MKEISIVELVKLLSERQRRGYTMVPEVILKRWMDSYGQVKAKEGKDESNGE